MKVQIEVARVDEAGTAGVEIRAEGKKIMMMTPGEAEHVARGILVLAAKAREINEAGGSL